MSQHYKAIISDIDGTLTPSNPQAYPSNKVTQVVKKLVRKGIGFSLASGRPFFMVDYLVKHLGLVSPLITDNGAVISDRDGRVLWEAVLNEDESAKILKLIQKYPLFRASCDTVNLPKPKSIPGNVKVRKISIHDITYQEADLLIKKLEKEFKDLAIIRAASYKGEQFTDVYISNAQGTKQHAVLKYAQLMGISTDEIIGIGDGYNDFPLLMACGLKVAMGNAVADIKAIADYIAPSVEDDGMADVVEKYIL